MKDGFAKIVYLNEIEYLLGMEEWLELKISSLAMDPYKSRKYRTILDLSFLLQVFGMEILSVNSDITVTA